MFVLSRVKKLFMIITKHYKKWFRYSAIQRTVIVKIQKLFQKVSLLLIKQ